jgi:hypothetical protein
VAGKEEVDAAALDPCFDYDGVFYFVVFCAQGSVDNINNGGQIT